MNSHAISVLVDDRPGILYALTKVLADHHAQITYVDLLAHDARSEVVFEFTIAAELSAIVGELERLEGVHSVSPMPPMTKIYGKRIVIMGGGAQVGQVALG